jgi:hypothetical protein
MLKYNIWSLCGCYINVHAPAHEPAGYCSGDAMCNLLGNNWGFISQKAVFFIVAAAKTSNLAFST